MRAHCFQHVSFEGLGSIERFLKAHHFEISYTRFYEDVRLPNLEEIDFLIIMGGPMSVNDEDKFSWLKAEKQFIRAFIKTKKPVLGICLGAQLIASSMGTGPFRILCQSGKITNTQGHRYEDRNRRRAICSRY